MARRQPYQQTASAGAPPVPETDNDTLETDEGGLQITLADADLAPQLDLPLPPERAPVPEPRAPLREPEQEPARSADDEAYIRLKAQLERTERERQEAQNRAGQAEKERSSYEDSLRAERERADALHRDHLVSQELAIENALRVAENAASAAEDAIQRSLENADYQAAAKANAALTQAYNDIAKLREGKQAITLERSRPAPTTAAPKPEARQDGGAVQREPATEWERVEAYITQPAHPPRVQAYMRQHYDDLFANNGQRVNKLVAAHYEAKSQALPEFGDDYFRYVDQYMGYDKPAGSQQKPAPQPAAQVQQEQPPRQRTAIPPAAPVSRGVAVNQTSGTSITLTPKQVAFCRETGIDPKAYAKQILSINRGKTDPNYTGPRWTGDMGE